MARATRRLAVLLVLALAGCQTKALPQGVDASSPPIVATPAAAKVDAAPAAPRLAVYSLVVSFGSVASGPDTRAKGRFEALIESLVSDAAGSSLMMTMSGQ